MRYYLGVDAGGTKTEFVLGDDSRELARVRTGTIKRMKADAATAEANVQTALRELQAATAIPIASITRCCIGTAGDTVPLVVNWLREAFARHVGGELVIVGDVEIALDSVFFGGRGVTPGTSGRCPPPVPPCAGPRGSARRRAAASARGRRRIFP